jgi:hypothetical protein
MKQLEEKRETFQNIGISNGFLDMTSKAQKAKAKIGK